MPFKIIKLSRRGRYILSHKNSFLVRVQLLNNTVMDCTLTVENTGNDCLNAVANKLDLKEVQYFGLQYRNKQFSMRWIELDKPLKKQVDKNAQDPTLYFRVMYYVANLELLQQEITRYLFYLQLKNNVIDGCMLRSPEEAIELASYMLQAEFGNYNPDVHTVQYFRDFILFPEAMAPNEEVLDTLTKETLTLHQRHRGLTAPDAEFNYILKVIHLDGYGEECYVAKDSQNTDYELRCSFVGVVTRELKPVTSSVEGKEDDQSMPQYTGKANCYDWNSIDHIHCNKSFIILNMRKDDTTLQFQLEDVETAKYACRIFEMRRKFYSLNRQTNKKLAVENGETSIHRRPTLRRTQDTPIPEFTNDGGNNEQHQTDPAQLQQQEFISSQENLHYARQEAQYYASQTSLDHAYVSQTSLNHVPGIQQEYGYANGYAPGGSMYSSPSINSLGHSQTQLNQRSPASSNMSLSSERHLAGNGVPVYRCTPDYEQAVQQRRRYSSYLENQQVARQQTQNTAAAIQDGTLKPRPHSMIYSPQELLQQAIHGPHYAHYPPQNPPLHYHPGTPQRVDSASHLPASQTQLHRPFESSHESLPPVHGLVSQPQTHPAPYNPHEVIQPQIRLQGVGQVPGNAFLAASTPELANSMQQVKGYSGSEMQLLRHYTKPPPPYPRNNSTSTPDLSAHRQSGVSASTPDLHKGYGVPQGQRRTQVHPTLVEDGAYGPMHGQHEGFPQTVIRGVCTSVEGLHRPHQNMMPQQQRQAEQTVQAYLQQLNLDHTTQAGVPRPRHRHSGQPQSRHHRPVSYPPRLNHSNQILIEEQDFGRLPPVQQSTPMGNSQTNSSSSTVGSSYGSQQYIPQQHGSQISLQRAQLAPATQPVLTQYHPTPHRAEVHMTGSNGNIQYQPQATHMHPAETPDFDDDEKSDTVSSHLEGVPRPPTPQHSQMASNVTMVIHGSDSENTSGSDDEYSSDDEDTDPKPDFHNVPLTTIDNWHREKPTEMYVPPKPKNEFQTYAPIEPAHDMRPPTPYPEDQSADEDSDTNLSIPVIPVIATTDHDPPQSYRKPDMMESFDEGDIGQVSVFPHPNPSSLPHSPKLSNTNPFYIPDVHSANPFYTNNDVQVNNQGLNANFFTDYHADTGGINIEKGAHGLFADITSDGLRQSRHSMRKSPLKLSNTSLEIYDLPSPSAGTPDERVLQLEKQVEDGQVLIEFEKIPKTRDPGEILRGDPSGYRDRVKKALAYPENRIQISSTGANPDGYINASLIKSNVGGQEWQHILCQNPMEDFTEEFWEMVWDQNVSIIAMISREVEDGRNRCGRYWPEQAGDPNALLFGNYRISSEIISDLSQTLSLHGSNFDYDQNMARSRTGSTACENLITSRLLLQKAGTTECHKLWHLQYVGWPDSGAPKDATDFLAFLEELESVRRLADDVLPENGVPSPVLIHCASGSGRSGVFVLCDLMRHTLEHNETTTVPEMLESLRRQRPNVVQTVSQYNFVYQVLILFLKNSRLI